MANNFSGDSNCVAVFDFENDITDSKGNNDLTNSGISFDATNKKVGSYSGSLDGSADHASIANSSLDSGFPGKNGESFVAVSVGAWVRITNTSVTNGVICGIYDTTNNKRSWVFKYQGGNGFNFLKGYNAGASYEATGSFGVVTQNQWYHAQMSYLESSKYCYIQVWDDTAGQLITESGYNYEEYTFSNPTNVEDAAFDVGRYASGSNYFPGNIDELVIFKDVVTSSEFSAVRQGTYGPETISAACADGITLGDSASRTKRISAGCADGVSLGDAGGNIAQLHSAASDGVTFSDSADRTARIAALVADGIMTGDGCSISKLLAALAADGISLADSAAVVAALSVAVGDGIALGDSPSVMGYLRAAISDGVFFGDLTTGDLLGVISAIVSDGVTFSDSAAARANLSAAATDSARFGDAVTTVLKALAQASDGVTFSDDAAWSAAIQALAADGITLSDSAARVLRKAALAADGITVSDSGSVNATFRVEVADGVDFLAAVSVIARLGAMVSDGIKLSDSAASGSAWTGGKVTMTMALKHGTLTFTITKAGADFTMKQPRMNFNLQ